MCCYCIFHFSNIFLTATFDFENLKIKLSTIHLLYLICFNIFGIIHFSVFQFDNCCKVLFFLWFDSPFLRFVDRDFHFFRRDERTGTNEVHSIACQVDEGGREPIHYFIFVKNRFIKVVNITSFPLQWSKLSIQQKLYSIPTAVEN